MTLIVGLGNPDLQYKNNRHNVGFMVVDGLIDGQTSCEKITKTNFKGELFKAPSMLLLKPSTYMNLSGESVRAVSDYFKPDHVIVIHDDLDLPFGTLRFKIGGGHGGHNGLRSIDAHIGVEYTRVRIGIGKPAHKSDVAKYVLSDFSACQRKFLPEILVHVTKSVQALLLHDLKEVSLQYSLKQTLCGGDEV
ncbi:MULTISPECIES: aminoacyl-tRNA hydrolase [Sulfurospirillum]|jgi:PTH1 family peptidyl-tRNA hydrolase|uniref:Peptidyl-tRNA hydrolase n=1 Tax=Sulfurospirillum cavolei TaxID=366522 RepID=A0A2D3WAC7_9BACT|nr:MULTISPECIES: aminoacyl-tRNA hydrolase [Sulfurospirillum]KHG34773.1 MAG: peptidyl-tRNA hydrolase [Sulfurospirillum sp. MES]MCP3652309.1 aminoacyl-tRNA hydrolase [Sulfurospirillum sp. DNRA8]MCR1811159.1 aminoacyl-tRNA hydrolase [Sulfurospirillum sp. DNRA8]DAB36030.1 MAG TPA: aminoacyl-tRNA hydrolase [Sulfurospirillum cavolei]